MNSRLNTLCRLESSSSNKPSCTKLSVCNTPRIYGVNVVCAFSPTTFDFKRVYLCVYQFWQIVIGGLSFRFRCDDYALVISYSCDMLGYNDRGYLSYPTLTEAGNIDPKTRYTVRHVRTASVSTSWSCATSIRHSNFRQVQLTRQVNAWCTNLRQELNLALRCVWLAELKREHLTMGSASSLG